MNRFCAGLIILVVALGQLARAETERDWLSDEETEKQIFNREVVLPASAIPEMINSLDRVGDTNRSSMLAVKKKLQGVAPKLTIMDVATISNIERTEMAWFYDLLATNKDPVLKCFGLIPQVLVLKSRAAATNLYALGRAQAPNGDQWLIENCLHGIGIDPQKDTPESIFEFISTMRDETRPAIGSVAKNFEIPDLNGKVQKLLDFRGKPVLLHFWSTTCGPCLAEFPALEKELKAWKTSHPDLVVLGISLDDDIKGLKKFLTKYDFRWIAACDRRGWGGDAAKAFHVTGIPNDVVIDSNGKIFSYSWMDVPKLIQSKK